jgi:hypothetical protein
VKAVLDESINGYLGSKFASDYWKIYMSENIRFLKVLLFMDKYPDLRFKGLTLMFINHNNGEILPINLSVYDNRRYSRHVRTAI